MEQARDVQAGCTHRLDPRQLDVTVLNRAIDSFNVTAVELEQSYRRLHGQVRKLSREIEEKNLQLEKNLEEKEHVKQFLSHILESIPDGVLVTDLQGSLLMCNSAVEKITGAGPEAMDRAGFSQWLGRFVPAGGPGTCAGEAGVRDMEHERACGDVRSLKISTSPVNGSDGGMIARLMIMQDQTRLKKLEEQARRDSRLKAMGEMAITIAHEVRNPLGSIELLASILRHELDSRPDLQNMTGRIVTQVKSLDNTISNLLLFTRPQQPALHDIDLVDLLDEFVDFIRPVLSKNGIRLHYQCAPVPVVAGDRDLLKQVVLNLTLNAVQAMPDGGSLEILLQPVSDEAPGRNRWAEIVFCDTGPGIPADSIDKIFHPFFSTKDKGTGLGLAIVHNIIESHAGTLAVRSTPGRGATFTISLPGDGQPQGANTGKHQGA